MVSGRSEGRVFRGREWQVAKAVRSEERAGDGRFLAVVLYCLYVRFDSPFEKITLAAFGKRIEGQREAGV